MARLTLRFAVSARAELNDILGYIALANPVAAAKLATQIESSLQRLLECPESGRLIPEESTSRARELVVPPLIRIFFRVEGSVVRVLHIMRAEQSFPPKGW
jgi:toxin ParE1/3/4